MIESMDLREYSCPLLFVQFKWSLKQLPDGQKITFIFSKHQDVNDVMRYLERGLYHYQIKGSGEQVLISVERIGV